MMNKKSVLIIGGVIGTIIVMFFLCSSVIVFASLIDYDGTPTPTRVINSRPIQEQTTYSLQVRNETSYSICYLYMSSNNSTVWGPDQLGSGTILYAHRSFTLYNIAPGIYDIRAKTCGGQEIERYEIAVYSDKIWTLYN
jgi:hypothetical protein